MQSKASAKFFKLLEALPVSVQEKAEKSYRLWKVNPFHPGLEFKAIQGKNNILYSVRIDDNYRALSYWEDDMVYWFWIGPHHEYDKLVKRL